MRIMPTSSARTLTLFTRLFVPTAAQAMSGMDRPHTGHWKTTSYLSQNIGKPINPLDAESEITYSADGNTAIFASGRKGSIPSPGVLYSFDIWMAHKVNGAWQAPIHSERREEPHHYQYESGHGHPRRI